MAVANGPPHYIFLKQEWLYLNLEGLLCSFFLLALPKRKNQRKG